MVALASVVLPSCCAFILSYLSFAAAFMLSCLRRLFT